MYDMLHLANIAAEAVGENDTVRARFGVVHVLCRGMWTWPLQQGCVNKCEIFKHYLLPITLNVHVPRSCFLKIKNRVRSRHLQRPNPCTPKFFHILVTQRRQHSAHTSAPKAAAAASRAGPCPASWETQYRCICTGCSQKLGIQRCQGHKGHQHSSTDQKIIFLAIFTTLGCNTTCMEVCQGHSREEEKWKGLHLKRLYSFI